MKKNLPKGAFILTRKLMTSLITILFALVALGTTTFAWLSLATTNIVGGFNLSITTGTEIQISLDGVNYSTKLTNQQILSAIGDKLKLIDVTSMDGIHFRKGGPEEGEDATPNQDYVSLTVFFRSVSPSMRQVYFFDNVKGLSFNDVNNVDKTFFVSKGVSWRTDVSFINDINGTKIVPPEIITHYASDALRISLIEQELDFDPETRDTYHRFIFDPSENEERGFGKTYGALSYWNAKHKKKITPPTNIPNTLYELTPFVNQMPQNGVSKVVDLYETPRELDGTSYFVGKTTINIWLEGWDADCFNPILKDQIKIQLVFRGA